MLVVEEVQPGSPADGVLQTGDFAAWPALFAALNICEREEERKVSLREFLSWSVPFTLVAAGVCYVIGMLVWVLPYAR